MAFWGLIRIPDIRFSFVRYLAGCYPKTIPDIRPDTGNPAGYWKSGRIPEIRPDTGYPAGYRIFFANFSNFLSTRKGWGEPANQGTNKAGRGGVKEDCSSDLSYYYDILLRFAPKHGICLATFL